MKWMIVVTVAVLSMFEYTSAQVPVGRSERKGPTKVGAFLAGDFKQIVAGDAVSTVPVSGVLETQATDGQKLLTIDVNLAGTLDTVFATQRDVFRSALLLPQASGLAALMKVHITFLPSFVGLMDSYLGGAGFELSGEYRSVIWGVGFDSGASRSVQQYNLRTGVILPILHSTTTYKTDLGKSTEDLITITMKTGAHVNLINGDLDDAFLRSTLRDTKQVYGGIDLGLDITAKGLNIGFYVPIVTNYSDGASFMNAVARLDLKISSQLWGEF